jgi:pimeloyl-ACP methyl ester carboxylesterase
MYKKISWVPVVATCWLAVAPATAAFSQTVASRFEALGAAECEDSELLCMAIDVPLDHSTPQAGETLQITYALSPAANDSLGILIYVVGGPGAVGVADAEYYLSDMSPQIIESYDIVFFDLRGVGPEHGVSCPEALDTLFRGGGLQYDDVPDEDHRDVAAAVDSYISQCALETGHSEILENLGTDQAVRDLEVFRQAIGTPQFWLYGHSYGTEFVQEYAAVYPAAVSGVILDSVVDPEITLTQFHHSALTAAEAILARLFATCDADAACAADMGVPTAQAYETLQTRLAVGPIAVEYPLAEGGYAHREIDAGLLLASAYSNLYGTGSRSWFLRVLAAANRGDFVPLLRDSYYESSIDVETDQRLPGEDEGYYLAAYYAIVCDDWTEGSDPDAEIDRILATSHEMMSELPHFFGLFFQELSICARMALPPSIPRPVFVGGDYPTLVMNSSTDPITPIGQARAVFERSKNAALIILEGGPHVVWRLDYQCTDNAMIRLLIDGELPQAPVQVCRTDFAEAYVPLSLPQSPLDPLWLARSVLVEMDRDLALLGYAMDYNVASGCTHGGTVRATETEDGADLVFDMCSYWDQITINGQGTMTGADYEVESLVLNLTASQDGSVIGAFQYQQDFSAETDWISGTWNGAPITTTWLRE